MKWELQWHIQIVALYLSFFIELEFKNEFRIISAIPLVIAL